MTLPNVCHCDHDRCVVHFNSVSVHYVSNTGNQTPWKFATENPVVLLGLNHDGLISTHAGAAHVVRFGEEFHMLYWGRDQQGRNHHLKVVAPVNEPNRWRPVGGSLLGPQPDTSHNAVCPGFPFLLPAGESRRAWQL